jgi:hypothetical protein
MDRTRRGENKEGRGMRGEGRGMSFAHAVMRHSFFVRPLSSIVFLFLFSLGGLFSILLFAAEPSPGVSPKLDAMTPGEKVEYIERMSPTDKAELLRKEESFLKLSPAEKEKLRRLHREIQNDKDAAELRWIMRNYYEWWKSLPKQDERADLSLLPPEERVKRIKELLQAERNRNPLKNLSPKDNEVLQDWMEGFAKKFEEQFQKSLSTERKKEWEAKTERQRKMEIMFFLRQHWQRRMPPSSEDLNSLRTALSPETQKLLEGKSPNKQWQVIQGWLGSLARQKFSAQFGRRPGPLVDEKDLEEFFDSDKLSPQDREMLLNDPPEIMYHHLQQIYLSRKPPFEFIFRPGENPNPGGPGGANSPGGPGGPNRPNAPGGPGMRGPSGPRGNSERKRAGRPEEPLKKPAMESGENEKK